MKKQLAAEFVLLAALWGSSFLFMRFGAAEFGAWATAGARVAVASIALLPVLLLSGQWNAFRQNAGRILFVGVLNSGLPFALYAYALLSITTGLSAILNATVPLFGALVAWLWLKERPGQWRAVGLAIGFVGVALLSWNKASFKPGGTGWAVVACLGATLCYGIAASITRKHLTGVPALTITSASLAGAALALIPATYWYWPAQTPGVEAWGAIVALGLFCTAWAYVLFYRLIAEAGPAKALTVTFIVPLFALLYGALLLGEVVTLAMAGYGLVILLGGALSTEAIKPQAWLARQPRS